MKNLGILVDDNPISRCYLKILKDKDIKLKSCIYLINKKFFFYKLFAKQNFYTNNYYAIKFLGDSKFSELISKVENYFGYNDGFCKDMYKFENLFEISEKLIYSENKSINSLEVYKILISEDKKIFINTGKEIIKKPFETHHEFLHIHPGYLPLVRGADSSLWHIKNFDFMGVSSFFMTRKIDEGRVILRNKLPYPVLKIEKNNKVDTKTLYRFWFSFIDPLLRGIHFKKIIENDFKSNIELNKSEPNNYFSFMDKNNLSEVFSKIFKK